MNTTTHHVRDAANRTPATPTPPRASRVAFPRYAATVVTAAGVWCLVSLAFHNAEWTTAVNIAFGMVALITEPNVFLFVFYLILGEALRRRLKIAWVVAFASQTLNIIIGLLGMVMFATSYEEIVADPLEDDLPSQTAGLWLSGITFVIAIALVVVLWRCRRDFPAPLRKGSWTAAALTLLGGLTATVLLIWFIVAPLVPANTTTWGPLWWSARSTLGVSPPFGVTVPADLGPQWLASAAGSMAAAVLLGSVWVALRTRRQAELMSARDELDVRALLLGPGRHDSLGYFATRRDKSVIFAPDRSAAVSYRVMGTVSLASGDPIGPPSSWSLAIAAWLADARAHAWHPAVLSASEAGARAYRAAGLSVRAMGDEAVVDVDRFSLDGRDMRPVKRAVARVRAAGCTVTVHRHADLPDDQRALIGQLSEQWRGNEPDRGFSMALNRIDDPSDGRNIAVLVMHGDDIVALQSFVPWGLHGLSLDLMRRSPRAPNGVNEAMVAGLMDAAPDVGIRHVSLNFAMFRDVFARADDVDAGLGVKLADRLLSLGNRLWQLESLAEANAKYQPRWERRYMCYDGTTSLPRIGIAAGTAEGFIPGTGVTPTRTGRDPHPDDTGRPRPFAELVAEQEKRLLTPAPPTRRLTQQQHVRHTKLDALRAAGMDAYPVSVPRTHSVADALTMVDAPSGPISLVGRVRALRDLGGVLFAVIDEGGHRIQALLDTDRTGQDALTLWRRTVDTGDHVSLTGTPGHSRRGEPSLLVDAWAMASKCLRPIPALHATFSDPEARIRQRALDLVVNRDSYDLLMARSRAVTSLRQSFAARGYAEVETPMLQSIHGGASARPFRTHINAYKADLYLRIAPEIYLKHLCVGGMDRIFELNRNFRNEGADATHNPEFTSLEAYEAHGDYTTMRHLTRDLILEAAVAVHGEPIAVRPTHHGGTERIRLDVEWPVVSVHEAASRATATTITTATPLADVRSIATQHNVHWTPAMTAGEIVLEIYDELVEGSTTLPTFYTDFPLETSPLARTHRTDPALSERWDLVAFGAEIGTAYSELIDPVDQRQRLTEQSFKAAAGDPEAMEVDEAFLTALEYGMPPTGGMGLGVDRLVMMLTGTTIRATLAFPFTKPTTA